MLYIFYTSKGGFAPPLLIVIAIVKFNRLSGSTPLEMLLSDPFSCTSASTGRRRRLQCCARQTRRQGDVDSVWLAAQLC